MGGTLIELLSFGSVFDVLIYVSQLLRTNFFFFGKQILNWKLAPRGMEKYDIFSSYRHYSSLEVASEYFRSGADKISIGSDAVYAAEEYLRTGVCKNFL